MKNLYKLIGIIALAAIIGFSMTACPEDDGGRELSPEEKPVQDRWSKYVHEDSSATLEYEVDADGVCKITIGGTAETYAFWKAGAHYDYTAKANTIYTYEFEAWTESGSGNRNLNIMYYNGWPEEVYFDDINFIIDSARKTYTFTGRAIPKGGVNVIGFRSATKIGTFYVKVLNIKEAGTVKSITITGIPENYDMAGISIFDGNETSAGGEGEISGGSVTIPLMIEDGSNYYNPIYTPFTGSGEFYVQLRIGNSSTSTVKIYMYANGTTLPAGLISGGFFDLTKLPKVSITGGVTTIAFNKFAYVDDIDYSEGGSPGGPDPDYD